MNRYIQNGIGSQRMLCGSGGNKNIFSACLKVFFLLIICFYVPLVNAVNEEDYRVLRESIATVRNGMNPQMEKTGGGFFIDKNLLVTSYSLIQDLVDPNDRSTFSEAMVEVKTPGNIDVGIVSAVDPHNDLAIIKTLEDGYKPFDIGSGREVVEGETVFTIKDPNLIVSKDFKEAQEVFLEGSVGSRIGNEMFYYPVEGEVKDHSGLPVFSKDLKVVGIASWVILVSGGKSIFAIPVNKLKTFIEEHKDVLEIKGPLSEIRPDSIREVQLDTYIKTPIDMVHLGLVYEFGFGSLGRRDLQKAFDWYEKAANEGDIEGNFHLGRVYAQRGNFLEGFEKLEIAAGEGHSEAIFLTSNMRYHGHGIPKDVRGAFEGFKILAEKGYPDAQFMVGTMIEFGQEVQQNLKEAFDWYEKAADQGHMEANYYSGRILMKGIGTLMPPDFKKAFERLDVAAEQGHMEARFIRATMLYQELGVKRDIPRAFREFEILAGEAHLAAWFNMALMRYQGLGIARNEKRAFEEFSVLARAGHMDATFMMAFMRYHGHGTSEDVKGAFKGFSSLAERGHLGALFNKSMMLYYEPTEVTQNVEESFEGFKALAEQNYLDAILQVGLMTYLGIGVQKDPKEAARWFEKGAVLGEVNAQFQYARLLYFGEGVSKDIQKARYWFERSRGKEPELLCPY